MSDPLMERLAGLPGAEPETGRTLRTRAQCRARLAAHAAPAAASTEPRVGHGLWRPAIAVLGVLYMIEALMLALRVYRLG